MALRRARRRSEGHVVFQALLLVRQLSVSTPWSRAREAQNSWLAMELDNGTSGWIRRDSAALLQNSQCRRHRTQTRTATSTITGSNMFPKAANRDEVSVGFVGTRLHPPPSPSESA